MPAGAAASPPVPPRCTNYSHPQMCWAGCSALHVSPRAPGACLHGAGPEQHRRLGADHGSQIPPRHLREGVTGDGGLPPAREQSFDDFAPSWKGHAVMHTPLL